MRNRCLQYNIRIGESPHINTYLVDLSISDLHIIILLQCGDSGMHISVCMQCKGIITCLVENPKLTDSLTVHIFREKHRKEKTTIKVVVSSRALMGTKTVRLVGLVGVYFNLSPAKN